MRCQTAHIHLGLCCGLGLLWLFLSTNEQTAWLPVSTGSCSPPTYLPPPSSPRPAHPPPYTQHSRYSRKCTNASQIPTISASCQLCSYNASYKTTSGTQSSMATIKHKRKYSVLNISNWYFSKCDNMVSFCKSIYIYVCIL